MAAHDAVLAEAIDRLARLIEDARQQGAPEADAAALATATREGRPSVRTVGIVRVDARALVFFADEASGKGRQLAENPQAALCFHWPGMKHQVLVEGDVAPLPEDEADALWSRVPREYGLGHWASTENPQAADVAGLRASAREVGRRFSAERVPRAPGWRAFGLVPRRFDFWQSGWQRLHLHREYLRDEHGAWQHASRNP